MIRNRLFLSAAIIYHFFAVNVSASSFPLSFSDIVNERSKNDVIVDFAGEKVSEHSLPRLVASMPVGKQVALKVMRDGKAIDLTVIISKLEEIAPETLIAEKAGIKTKTLTPEIAPQFGIMDGGGALITEVVRKGTNLKAGDIIIEANGIRVNSTKELALVIREAKPAERLVVFIKRGSGYLYGSLNLGE